MHRTNKMYSSHFSVTSVEPVLPTQTSSKQQQQQQQQQPCDMCKIFRDLFNATTSAIASSPRMTGIIVSIPMISVVIGLIYAETRFDMVNFNGVSYSLQAYKNIILSPIYTITVLTVVSGITSLVGLYFSLQNLVGVAAYVYSAIAYWAIINICIVVVPIWYYFSVHAVGTILSSIIFCALAWLFTGAVMDSYRININKAIELTG